MRFKSAALAPLFVLIACEKKPDIVPASEPPPAAAQAAEVAAADSYGSPGTSVTDVDFWSHASIAFQGLLLAATPAGIDAFRIETGELAFAIPGGASALEIFYAGAGAAAGGYLLAAGDGSYRLYAINPDGAGYAPVATPNAPPGKAVFCTGGGLSPQLFEIAGGAVTARSLMIVPNGAEFGPARPVATVPGAIGCSVDPLTDQIVAVGADGAIRRIDADTGAVFGLALPENLNPAGAALAAGRNDAGETSGQVALLDAASGVVSLFDAKDGHALGSVRVKATFDLDAVASAKGIAIGSANYGGVYRDGALAVVASGDAAPIRLVPWNGVLGALSLPLSGAIDPRAPAGNPAEERVISIDLIEP